MSYIALLFKNLFASLLHFYTFLVFRLPMSMFPFASFHIVTIVAFKSWSDNSNILGLATVDCLLH